MHKIKFIITLLLLFSLIEISSAKNIEVTDLTEAGLNDALKAASPGDIVNLPECDIGISKQLVIAKGVTLKGTMQGDVHKSKLHLAKNAKFARQEPVILALGKTKIQDIHFDFNSENQPSGISMGDGYYNGIGAYYQDDIEIVNCWLDNSLGDLIRLRSCTNVDIHDNKITRAGHEGIFLIMCELSKVHDNYIEPRDNTAVRLWGGHSIRIFDNTVYFSRTDFEGNTQTACHAFQVQMDDAKKMSDIEICGNYVSGMLVSDVWAVDKIGDSSEDPVWIHHNVFLNSGGGHGWGSGSIIINGLNALVEHNVFDGCQGAAISIQSYKGAWGTEAIVQINNNIFNNIDEWAKTGDGGYGISDSISADISTEDNCFYAVQSGYTHGCTLSSSDYFVNPKSASTSCDIKWKNGEWVIPGVTPKSFGDSGKIYDKKDEVTDEEIQEFDSIFDLLDMTFYDFAGGNYSIVLPEGVSEIPENSTWTIEQHENCTLVYGPDTGLTSVKVEYAGKEGIHTLMLGERQGWQIVYSNVSIWKGDIKRSGDSFYLDGKAEPEEIKIKCYNPKGSFDPGLELVKVEEKERGLFNSWLYVYLSVLSILLCVPVAVVVIVFRR